MATAKGTLLCWAVHTSTLHTAVLVRHSAIKMRHNELHDVLVVISDRNVLP